MFRPRIIPCLLLKDKGLVKTVKFKSQTYIGDPINAVKIFNDLEADELVFLDITATKENRLIPIDLVQKIGDEAFMPFAVGGGIKNIDDIRKLLNAGAEKVVINSSAFLKPDLIKDAANLFGSQSIIVSIDVRKNNNNYKIYIRSGTKSIKYNLIEYVKKIESFGAGEILINSIDNDGLMKGYDIDLIKSVSESVNIPVIAIGGAGSLNDFKMAVNDGLAHAVAAGSLFVYHGPRKGVLINYPSQNELKELFNK